MKSHTRIAGLLFVAVLLAALATTSAYAQGAPSGLQPGGQGQGGLRPGQGPGGAGANMRQMAAMVPPAIAVSDGFVFVVYGGTLYQFTVDGLKLVAQVDLPGRRGGNRPGGPGGALPPAAPQQ